MNLSEADAASAKTSCGTLNSAIGAVAAGHSEAVQMMDTSVVRVRQHCGCIAGSREQHMGRSCGNMPTAPVHL